MSTTVTRDAEGTVTGNTYDKYGSTNPVVKRLMAGFEAAYAGRSVANLPNDLLAAIDRFVKRTILLCAHLDTVPLAAPVEVAFEGGVIRTDQGRLPITNAFTADQLDDLNEGNIVACSSSLACSDSILVEASRPFTMWVMGSIRILPSRAVTIADHRWSSTRS